MNELYKDPSAPVEDRVNDLLGRMTTEEKIGQLVQSYGEECETEDEFCQMITDGKIGSRIVCGSPWAGNDGVHVINLEEINKHQKLAVEGSRLGIPLIVGRDVIHGHRTIAPIPLAQAASWNPEGVRESAAIAAEEATSEGINWTFAPMMDICRDPRWGRVIETLGEDPHLASEMAVAMVKGFQGEDNAKPNTMVACAKHFAGYGYAEGGRDYDCSEITKGTLYNTVLPPFKAALQKGGCCTVMTSFQSNSGIPATASNFLLKEILRDNWNFDGFVISDWAAINQIEFHGACENEKEAVEKAFNAGVDMEMVNKLYPKYLPELFEQGKTDLADLDKNVANVLRTKFRAGLFENPYTDTSLKDKVLFTSEKRDAVRDQAADCSVLAKNNGILPMSDLKGKKIAVIGPMAHERRSLLGSWTLSGLEEETTNLVEAFKELMPESEIISCDSQLFDMQILAARHADVVVCCVGEGYLRTGETHAISRFELPPGQEEFINSMARYGQPMIVLCATGRPFPIPAAEQHADALMYIWHGGTESARATVDIIKGDKEPAGRLPITVPRHGGQIPIYYGRKHPGKINDFGTDQVFHFYDDDVFEAQYPFGFGLSYTSFEISDLKIASDEIKAGANNKITLKVTNTGKRSGSTVVQCYIRDPQAQLSRPVKELVAFNKIALNAGESKDLVFEINDEAIGYYTPEGEFRIDSGEIQVGVGFDSTVELDNKFTVE